MSKLSFRARALDAAKPLPVYCNGDIPDLTDCVSISRAVPQMPTGMEKEEESEHHLQRAICAQQVFREKKDSMVIPVPEAQGSITYYDRLYKGDFLQPKQLIHIQPFGLDSEQPDYDMDSEDETLLNRLNRKMELKPLQFEIMVDRLEKASANQLVTLQEAKLLLNEDDYLLKSVYDYWVRKRKNCCGPSLIPQIRQEKRDGSTNNDAYVAFRRRTEKMQTRKNRKNDEASYEKMLKLRREFSRAITILEMVKKREKSKRELLHLTLEVVEKRYQMSDFSGDVLNEVSAPLAEKTVYPAPICVPNGNRHKAENKIKTHKSMPKHHPHHFPVKIEPQFNIVRGHKKYTRRPKLEPLRQHAITKADIKQYDFHSSGEEENPLSPSSEPDEENDPDGGFVFRRRAGCHYLAPVTDKSSVPVPRLDGIDALCQRNSLTALSVPRRCIGVTRRRMGRGGRVLLDRTSSDLDRVLRHLDPDTVSPSDSLPVLTDTQTNAHVPISARAKPQRSLAQLLNDIQACRWRYFRPRPRGQNGKEESKPGTLQDNRRGGGGGGGTTVANSSRSSSLGGITEEQFQSHQQQLAQMLQQQGLQQNPPLSEHSHAHVSKSASSGSLSKTLDSASAHFAASAVVSGSNKDLKPHSTGVNGILTNSGSSRPSKFSCSSPLGVSSVSSGSSSSTRPPAVPQSVPHVSVVSPARPCAPSSPTLKLASVASSSLERVPKVTLSRDKHEPERLALNGLADTTVAMEVT
ncbi:enhancer of polycomb homolog 2 [Neoarius graeffei]|uniref:enhancer of polycomb homolog 2 n=1 Tax=Neoarius graeffei TaxID=443677 RepID=UPI00298CB8A0|nr:enhancer of polycomb homolog 2 [Neoarius graeffei]